ncbi:MAG: response regulator transcription factor [Ruminococcus bicirculans (ex Wegman et al. 2014)]
MSKIIVIDDDTSLLQLIKNALENEHTVTIYNSLVNVSIREINSHDLLILDVMMPQLDGFTFLKEKRREIDIPVLFLTAKNFEQDLIEGFSVGADDYIVKPFSIKELRYRIMAHLRREKRTKNNLIHIGNIFCDFTEKKIYVDETEINMTSTEYEICSLLIRNPNRVFTKDEIYEKIFGYDGVGDAETTIRERVKEIRKKFKAYQEEPIKTVWGVGYQWEKNQ